VDGAFFSGTIRLLTRKKQNPRTGQPKASGLRPALIDANGVSRHWYPLILADGKKVWRRPDDKPSAAKVAGMTLQPQNLSKLFRSPARLLVARAIIQNPRIHHYIKIAQLANDLEFEERYNANDPELDLIVKYKTRDTKQLKRLRELVAKVRESLRTNT
jgi:hypothetical protein